MVIEWKEIVVNFESGECHFWNKWGRVLKELRKRMDGTTNNDQGIECNVCFDETGPSVPHRLIWEWVNVVGFA
jgi:hypothetical protein